ncbi:MAG: hypothetical protein P8R42_15805 [Candidatus Binatia bacterium]|nr:hypothetical protein [Candidatus Binatia bacterium]
MSERPEHLRFGKLNGLRLSNWIERHGATVSVIETWRRHYNEVRPRSSQDCQTPTEFKNNINPPAEAISQ